MREADTEAVRQKACEIVMIGGTMIETKTIECDYRVASSLLKEICIYLDVDESKLTIHMHEHSIIAIARQLAHHRESFKDV